MYQIERRLGQRQGVANAIEREGVALGAMTSHYKIRASSLKNRYDILKKISELRAAEQE